MWQYQYFQVGISVWNCVGIVYPILCTQYFQVGNASIEHEKYFYLKECRMA